MKYKLLRSLIERDVLALGEELFGYDTTLIEVVETMAKESECGCGLSDQIYDVIAKGVMGDVEG